MKRNEIILLLSLVLLTAHHAYSETNWQDTFYQYRLPVVLDVENTGWNVIPLNEAVLSNSINLCREMTYDPLWFAYNHLKVVEIDQDGQAINDLSETGFTIVPQSEELFTAPITGQDQTVSIPTEKEAYYLVRYLSDGAGGSPLQNYAQIFPIGTDLRKHAYMSSYEAPLLPKALTQHERLLKSDGQPMEIHVKDRYTTNIKDISVKKVKILFLANFKLIGPKQWMLYYQPMCGHHLTIPQLRRETIPESTALVKRLGRTEKYTGSTAYQITSSEKYNLWFAESTVKVTPDTPVPNQMSSTVHISAAKNEAQSFQLMLSPQKLFKFDSIEVKPLKNKHHIIDPQNVECLALEYVNIQTSSYITPVKFLGVIADPLVEVSPKQLSPLTGNLGFWITVNVPAQTPAGIYKGKIVLKCTGATDINVPLELEVYNFELPEFASFQSSLGLQLVTKDCGEGRDNLMDYHGLSTKVELKKLFKAYCQIMAKNKFYPKTAALYSEIGMKWSPPPQGYNVDAAGNVFRLYDWDFSQFNEEMKYYIDELKINSVCLTHNNPSVSNMFKHLPGDELNVFFDAPPHVTMAWQTFRKHTYVAWDKQPSDGFYDETIEITVKQFDQLLLDYYRKIVENLEAHGWLDKFYIQIDETDNVKRILHFVRLLKSDPHTAKLKIVGCMQGHGYLHHKDDPNDQSYSFNGLVTYVPENDENYQRWEDYFWTDYDLPKDRHYLWNYAVTGSRLSIDVPGINNRMIALDVFNRGGSGILDWEIVLWDSWYTGDNDNPWKNPHSVEGNGALSYFYPPDRKGISNKPNYKVTPSLRVETFRESVDDYEYALILENLISQAKQQGVDAETHEAIFVDISRFFDSSVNWSQNDAWYLELRNRMARAIVELKPLLKE